MRIAGSVVIITGASSGIGAATAREVARRGAKVVLAARRADQLHGVAEEIHRRGGKALVVPTDVSQRAAIDRLVDTTIDSFGRVDVLVNNAATWEGVSVPDSPDGALQYQVAVNLLGPTRGIQAVLPYMRRQGGGLIINTGSVVGEIAGPRSGLYAATKLGLRGLSDALRRELEPESIAVVLVEPGHIRNSPSKTHWLPMPGPEVVARAVADAIERPRRRVVIPGFYRLLIFAADLLPWLADAVLRRQARRYISRSLPEHRLK
jgi:NAD(P)-dependent dehydrogenase (short-subunit alcohol dehydrogenase family)